MYTHKDSKVKGLSMSARRLAIAQAISDEQKKRIDMHELEPAHFCAIVAHDLICAHDSKAWNSVKGDSAYQEVLSVLVGQGFVKMVWKGE